MDQRQTIEESLDLGRVEVTYQNEGQLSQEEEGFIEQLVLKEGYATILQGVSETVFNHSAFDPFTFDQKNPTCMIYLKLGGKASSAKAKRCFYQSFLNKKQKVLNM